MTEEHLKILEFLEKYLEFEVAEMEVINPVTLKVMDKDNTVLYFAYNTAYNYVQVLDRKE
ncbi:hypothetical protein [Clostridium sp. UBA1652]|uniref:hypothetical protein n=1 Tax=Clostridium sp. UBA1652 TaxID=1946348 RepID=UPI0025811EAC|nr:hypothetical protein [Clostridium sp. UBA1652]